MGLFLMIAAYFMGSIPTGLWIAQWTSGLDPRQAGSGNIGATNILRVAGKKEAACTLAADILKGFLPVLGALFLGADQRWVLLVGGAAILGHIFPIFLKFKGGKGVAVSLGVFLGIAPQIALFAFIIWLGGLLWGGYSSTGALAAFGVLPFLALFLKPDREFVLFSFLLSFLVCLRHHENIRRLLRGEEKRA